MEQVAITIDQNFFLFCCSEQYNINVHQTLSSKHNYFLRYTYPDGTTADGSARLSSENLLTSQSPEHGHSCTVHVRLYTSGEQAQTIAEFSLVLVSPIEYLFRKFAVNEFEMSEKISNKMTSALLAMSLAYYYVMGEHVEKNIRRTDTILSTFLSWSADDSYTNLGEDQRKGTSTDEDIAMFAQHYKLQKTLRYLSEDNSVGELPVYLPKSLLPPVEKNPLRRPAIIPRSRSVTLPANSRTLSIAVSKKVSNASSSEYSPLQPTEMDPQEGYMYMEKEDKYGANNDVPDNSDDEEYFLVDPPVASPPADDPKGSTEDKLSMLCKEPIKFSSPATLPRLPVEDFLPDENYELCDLTPAELAAVEIMKKRGPRPNRPLMPYRSHAMDKAGEYGKLREEGHFKSSLEESIKCSLRRMSLKDSGQSPPPLGPKPPPLGPKPPTLGPKPSVRQKPAVTSPKPVREMKAPPRKKHNILNKTKDEQPP